MARKLASSFVRKGTERTVNLKWESKDIKPIARVHIRYDKDGNLEIHKGFGNYDKDYWELIYHGKIVKSKPYGGSLDVKVNK